MTVGLPTGLTEEDVTEVSDASKSAAYRTGTGISQGPAVGEAFTFQTGAYVFTGDDIIAIANGRMRLSPGVYWLQAVIRSGNYSSATGLIVWQWKDFTSNENIGGQAIHYANSATSRYTHQPVMTAVIAVPAGQTRDVGPALIGITGGMTYEVSELRSAMSVLRIA